MLFAFVRQQIAYSEAAECNMQGVRIDYALSSPGLMEHIVSCEILSLPPKWSDHAALVLGLCLLP